MIFVLTVIIGGQFYQAETDPVTCRVLLAHNVAAGATYVKCERIRYVAA
jgi:hypothetical protein